MKPKTIFFGNPTFVIPVAEETHQCTDLRAVVTSPDKPQGQGLGLSPSPLKAWAEEHHVPVLTPLSLNDSNFQESLGKLKPDLFIVAAFGKIIPPEALTIPSQGALNIHPSLLPRWRGAAPVTHTLLAGDPTTGTTLIILTNELDAGPILTQKIIPLFGKETTGELKKQLFLIGKEILCQNLLSYLAGDLVPQPQKKEGVKSAPKIKNEDAHLDWSKSAEQLEREVRAYHPEPGSFFFFLHTHKKLRVKVLKAHVNPLPAAHEIGECFLSHGELAAATKKWSLHLDMVQPEGKKAMPGKIFLHGYRDIIGAKLL